MPESCWQCGMWYAHAFNQNACCTVDNNELEFEPDYSKDKKDSNCQLLEDKENEKNINDLIQQ